MTPKPQPPVSVTTSAQINIQQPQSMNKFYFSVKFT